MDPDGRELKVNGTEEFKTGVESSLQKIYPRVDVDTNTGAVTLSDNLFTKILNFFGLDSKSNKHSNGKELLDNLISSDNVHTITETQGGNAAGWANDYQEGQGSGSTVYFNPNKLEGGVDSSGSNRRPPFIGLAHELGHSEAIDNGTQSFPTSNTQKNIPDWEVNSMKRENEVRYENGLNLRPSY